jgi:Asp-tRNA(Asn)/Glu-tRNA(Gln) amidotransferase A subunit family amidase
MLASVALLTLSLEVHCPMLQRNKHQLTNHLNRGPAGCTGIYGFKASVARMPHAGLLGNHAGMDAIVGVIGPMARSLRDLALFCRVMSDAQSWLLEHAVLDFPWREEIVRGVGQPEKLTIAILWDDGFVRPHPPILRALEQSKKASRSREFPCIGRFGLTRFRSAGALGSRPRSY